MKSRLFAAFGTGALMATVALGTFQYVNAASDSTIAACASKSTGAMRLLSKGSCKKSETKISWNKQGPQGPEGPIGASSASSGPHVVDAAGRDFGVPLSATSTSATVFYDGGVWVLLNSPTNNVGGDKTLGSTNRLYFDSACTIPFVTTAAATSAIPNARIAIYDIGTSVKYFKPTGSPYSGSSVGNFYSRAFTDQCKPSTDSGTFSSSFLSGIRSSSVFYTNLTEVSPPPYLAPYAFVSR